MTVEHAELVVDLLEKVDAFNKAADKATREGLEITVTPAETIGYGGQSVPGVRVMVKRVAWGFSRSPHDISEDL